MRRTTKPFTMNMDTGIHKLLKQASLDRETSMAELVEEGLAAIGIKKEDTSSEEDSCSK